MDPLSLYTGAYVSLIGIVIVFTILSILALTIEVIPRILYRKKRVTKTKETIVEVKQPTIESRESKAILETKATKIVKDPDTVALVSAAITAFNEYKISRLKKMPLFKEFPGLTRILYLAGIRFKGKLIVSLGGSDKEVEVEEIDSSTYTVRVGGKTYRVIARYDLEGKPIIVRLE